MKRLIRIFPTRKILPPPYFNIIKLFNQYAAKVTAQGGERNQIEEGCVPPSVEDVAGYYQKEILDLEPLEYEPVEKEHYRKVNQEFE